MMFESHKTLISANQIQGRVKELARDLETRYADSDNLVLVCVLTGAKQFFDALSAELKIPHQRASVRVSSYATGTYLSTGNVNVMQPINVDLTNADVVVVEDIIDTGYSMRTVLQLVQDGQPKSVAVCALLSKPSRRVVHVPIDYLGFSIDDHFVFGYGIDVDQKYRELNYIGYFES